MPQLFLFFVVFKVDSLFYVVVVSSYSRMEFLLAQNDTPALDLKKKRLGPFLDKMGLTARNQLPNPGSSRPFTAGS
jgi:hypothetical protein